MKKLTQAEYLPIEKLKPFEGHPFYVKTLTPGKRKNGTGTALKLYSHAVNG